MKGRQPGRPTKIVSASVLEYVAIGKRGVRFEVWEKWKRKRRKLGTLILTVGGVRWRPQSGKRLQQKSWEELAEWFTSNPRLTRRLVS